MKFAALVAAASLGSASAAAARTKTVSLPDVEDVLSPSTTTLSKISTHVQSLDARVKDLASMEQKKVADTKHKYEAELTALESEVSSDDKQNTALKKSNEDVSMKNDELLKKATGQVAENQNLREVLAALKGKIASGVGFVDKVEESTDNLAQKPAVLAVLRGEKDADAQEGVEDAVSAIGAAAAKATLGGGAVPIAMPVASVSKKAEAAVSKKSASKSKKNSKKAASKKNASKGDDDDEDDDDDDDDDDDEEDGKDEATPKKDGPHLLKLSRTSQQAKPTSFLQKMKSVSVSDNNKPNLDWIRPTGADKSSVNIIQSLQQELNQLQQQENESLDSLQEVFNRKKAKVNKQKAEVLRVQKKLLSEQQELKQYQGKLSAAVSFLGGQKTELGKSLTQLGNFMRQLAHVALAPPQELEGDVMPELAAHVAAKAVGSGSGSEQKKMAWIKHN